MGRKEKQPESKSGINELLIIVSVILCIFTFTVIAMISLTSKLIQMEDEIFENASNIEKIEVLEQKCYSELIDIIIIPDLLTTNQLQQVRDAFTDGDTNTFKNVLLDVIKSDNVNSEQAAEIQSMMDTLTQVEFDLANENNDFSIRATHYKEYTEHSLNALLIRIINYKILDVDKRIILSTINDSTLIEYESE